MQGILGKKLGMTQIYKEDGTVIPVTVVQAGPCLVVQIKTVATDGYNAIQIGLVEDRPPRAVPKPMAGHFSKAGVAPTRRVAEFELGADGAPAPGDQIKCTIFAEDEYVDVVGKNKGKGFQGGVKRHGYAGGRASHGSMFHRAPGSIGASAFPSRVFPGTRLPGHMGDKQVTTKNLKVVKVDPENNLLYLRGAVPGGRGSVIAISRAKRG